LAQQFYTGLSLGSSSTPGRKQNINEQNVYLDLLKQDASTSGVLSDEDVAC
jgi:hypothetical protein